MLKCALAAVLVVATAGTVSSATLPGGYHLIPGRVPLDWQGPDGNTIVLDAPHGLIVVDTGRSPQHAQAILDYAKSQGKPIAAIFNSHWHLDHTTGNHDLRQAYPEAQVYATTAIEGALAGFLGGGREQADKTLADPKVPGPQKAQIRRGRYRTDNPDTLRPTRPVTQTGPVSIAGRELDLHVARFAATEADLWIYDPKAKVAMVGDLVVDIVPFMDTACADGWAKALDAVAAVPFTTLVPGHGPVMDRTDFLTWKTAFNNLLSCARSDADKKLCIAGWQKDAAKLIDEAHREYVAAALDYYIDTRLRSSPDEQQKYCKPLTAAAPKSERG